MMNEIDELLKRWFNECIPDTTQEQQSIKINEEMLEFNLAPTMELQRNEAVDVYISMRVFELMFNSIGQSSSVIKMLFDLSDEEILKKVYVNFSRNWVKNDKGVYHHQ